MRALYIIGISWHKLTDIEEFKIMAQKLKLLKIITK
jgi:hypothetical protein